MLSRAIASSEMDWAFAVQHAEGGIAFQRRHRDVLLRRQLQKQPLLLTVLGEKTDPVFNGRAREWITTGSPSTSIMPPVALRTPKISCASSERPAPTSPASPTISPERTCKLHGRTFYRR